MAYTRTSHCCDLTSASQLLGENGIFVADGPVWHRQRKLSTLLFNSSQFRDWIQLVVHGELDTTVALLDAVSSDAGEGKLEFMQLLSRFTLSSFAKMALSAGEHCFYRGPT